MKKTLYLVIILILIFALSSCRILGSYNGERGTEEQGQSDIITDVDNGGITDDEITETPDNTTDGEGTESPDNTTDGEGTETPDNTTDGEGTETPDNTTDGDGTETPDNTTDGEGTETPDNTTDGDGTEVPDNTTDGDGTETPDNTTDGDGTETEKEALPFTLTYISGTEEAYTYDSEASTLTFTEISEETVYAISGEFAGNIVIDVVNDYKFDLELRGFTLTSSAINPITILSGDEITLKAKNGYESFIYDNRQTIDATNEALYSASIYSLVDLQISGKGELSVISANNNGIHTKDDLQVKNLTLYVKCVDNALKGNDGVEIEYATTTLIATQGDCIKTTNSHINETTLKQKGTVTITGGVHYLYSACDGIDSAYNVEINDSATVLNIYTDKYSQYSEAVTTTEESTYYIRYSNQSYSYSIYYFNSDSDYLWENAEYYTSVQGGRSTYYYYKVPKKTGYSSFKIYMYSSSQAQGQGDNYYYVTDAMSHNSSYDTIALSSRMGSLSTSWTTYTTSSSQGGMGGMGGQMSEGNSDKGEYSTKGIKAANQIVVNAGTINIEAYDDAIHANNDGGTLENGEEPTGNVIINGGFVTVSSNDDGVHADGILTVEDGSVIVTSAYEGFEGYNIVINGGSISVTSSDDGFNSSATSGAGIQINGGNVYIYATGDGIDSNSTTSKGAILFTGGNTVVICNSNGNSAIDSDGGYTHTGGYVTAIMSSGGMTSESTNGSFVSMTTKSLSLSSNTYLTVTEDSVCTLAVKMPCTINAYIVYLGNKTGAIATASSISYTTNQDGVYFG